MTKAYQLSVITTLRYIYYVDKIIYLTVAKISNTTKNLDSKSEGDAIFFFFYYLQNVNCHCDT